MSETRGTYGFGMPTSGELAALAEEAEGIVERLAAMAERIHVRAASLGVARTEEFEIDGVKGFRHTFGASDQGEIDTLRIQSLRYGAALLALRATRGDAEAERLLVEYAGSLAGKQAT